MRKVAVVDDNADNRLIIRTILEDQYEVMEFSSGIEAIDGFRKDKPDIVILDISLPELDGTEILRRIRMILNSTIFPSSRLLHMRWSAIVRSTWRRDSTTTLPNPSWT